MNFYIFIGMNIFDVLFDKAQKAVDVQLQTSIVNLPFQLMCLIFFQKK